MWCRFIIYQEFCEECSTSLAGAHVPNTRETEHFKGGEFCTQKKGVNWLKVALQNFISVTETS